MMGPQIVPSAKEIDGKLSNVVRQISNVERNHFGTTDLSGPPSEIDYNARHTINYVHQ